MSVFSPGMELAYIFIPRFSSPDGNYVDAGQGGEFDLGLPV